MALRNKKREQDKLSSVRPAPQSKAQIANESERPVSPSLALRRAAGAPPSALRRADVLALQRSIGNRAVGRILGRQSHELPALSSSSGTTAQRKTADESSRTEFHIDERKENRTGLPDHLKAGIENLSGVSLDDVKVHYNSPAPAAVQALAYTQGADIHVGPGQGQHLPHEAWHVVQQKQGRVKPTLQAKGMAINDDAGLEREADEMGEKAKSSGSVQKRTATDIRAVEPGENRPASKPLHQTVQLLTKEQVAFYTPPTPFEANFKKNHIVTDDNSFTDQEALLRLANRGNSVNANTMLRMDESQGKTELEKALTDLTDQDAEKVDSTTYFWNTQNTYNYKTAKSNNNNVDSGNSKHKLGMKMEVNNKKEQIGIKIKHWEELV